MTENSTGVVREYLTDAIAAERAFETQLRAFAADSDDSEVQGSFASHADESRVHQQRLGERLTRLGGTSSTVKAWWEEILAMAPRALQAGHIMEERTARNLVTAFTVTAGTCALYEGLAVAAHAAGDAETEPLVRAMQDDERKFAQKVRSFIPSRSKIAFNMLTVDEVDPSVETHSLSERID
jgi:ferritin-like metal-binding protein YciE